MQIKHKKIWNGCLKLFGILMALYLLHHTLASTDANIRQSFSEAVLSLLFAALGCYGIVNIFTSWRWMQLLRIQGIRISFWQALRLNLIGVFFSNIIPGSVSGDIIKLAYIANLAPTKKTESALSIVVDRILGLLGLFLMGMFSSLLLALLSPEIILQQRILLIAILVIWGAGIAMILVLTLVMLRTRIESIFWIANLEKAIAKRLPLPILRLLKRLISAIELYKKSPRTCLQVTTVSLMIHSLLGVQNFVLGRAFGEKGMSFLHYLISTQIGNTSGIIPLTPGGMGLRDTVMANLFELFQASPKEVLGLIPVSYSASMVAWGLLGALLLVFTSNPQKKLTDE